MVRDKAYSRILGEIGLIGPSAGCRERGESLAGDPPFMVTWREAEARAETDQSEIVSEGKLKGSSRN